jgi:hypothetical protein
VFNADIFTNWTFTLVSISFDGAHDLHSNITAKELTRKLRCGIRTACAILQATMQEQIQHALYCLEECYKVNHLQLN